LIPFITLKKCVLDLSAEIISYWIIKAITNNYDQLWRFEINAGSWKINI